MKAITLLLAVPMLSLFPVLAGAQAPETEISNLVERFFKGYVQTDENNKSDYDWTRSNPALTRDFKRAYVKYFDQFRKQGSLDSDPILEAQDTPETPYKATSISSNGDRATVEVTTAGWPGHVIRVGLVKTRGKWLINSINKINQ